MVASVRSDPDRTCSCSLPRLPALRRESGFTLVELLVVIGIISALAAMLLPALRRSLAAARTVECANSEKQLGLTVFESVDDHEGYLPCANYSQNKTAPYQDELFPPIEAVSGQIRGYGSSLQANSFWLYFAQAEGPSCRSHRSYTTAREAFIKNRAGGGEWWRLAGNYAIAGSHFSAWARNPYVASDVRMDKRRLSNRPHPSLLFMAVESPDPIDTNARLQFGAKGYASSYTRLGFHHLDNTGFNALHFDGHVGFVALDHAVSYEIDYESNYLVAGGMTRENWD